MRDDSGAAGRQHRLERDCVLRIAGRQALDQLALDTEFGQHLSDVFSHPGGGSTREMLAGRSFAMERHGRASEPHRARIGMFGLHHASEMADLFVIEHLVKRIEPGDRNAERIKGLAHLGGRDVSQQGVDRLDERRAVPDSIVKGGKSRVEMQFSLAADG